MAWGWVQSKAASNNAVTSLTLAATLGTTPVTGRKIIVAVSAVHGGGLPTLSVKDSNSVALTSAGSKSNATGADITQFFFYDVPASPSTTFTVTATVSSDMSMVVEEYSGLLAGNTTACLVATAVGLTGSVSPTGTTGYNSNAAPANAMLVSCLGDF